MADTRNTKLICMDMDGTLFAKSEQIPEVNLQALHECERRGIHLALVSGRNYRFLMQNALRISENVAVVSSNGARIDECVSGACIYEGLFEEEAAHRTAEALWDCGVYYEIYTTTINYGLRKELIPPYHQKSLERYLTNGHILGCEFPNEITPACLSGIYKFVAFSEEPAHISAIRGVLDEKGILHSSSAPNNVEVMAPGVGKGNAVKILAKHLGVSLQDVMCFGDYTNDCDMLSVCGHPVAMENGVDALKAIAQIIAPRNTEGGVGQVINRYVLGIE